MNRFFNILRARLGKRVADENGSTTIEFVLMLPVIAILATASVEIGVIMSRYVMLERALDMSVRDIRLGATPTTEELVTEICTRASIIPDCAMSLIIDMQPIDDQAWDLPALSTPCYDREEDIVPATEFTYGAENQIVLIRACVIVDPLMATIGLGQALDDVGGGQFYLKAASAFVNEPA